MSMDLPTIALAVGLQYSMQAIGFFVLWRMNRALRGIGWWLATALLFAVGMPAFGIWSTTAHPLFGLVLPTLAVSTGMACFYIGAAAFGGSTALPRWPFGTVLLINQRQLHELRSITTERVREQEKRAETERRLAIAERELAEKRLIEQRQKILRDLHDGVGGVTANLALLAGLGTAARSADERGDLFRRIEQLATQGNRELRLLLDLFEQGDVAWADVLHEMRMFAANVTAANRIGLRWISGDNTASGQVHDPVDAISLTRAFKEAVNNTARHSQAGQLTVRIRFFRQALAISVGDDGIGLQANHDTPAGGGGRGLGQMRQRIEELGGRFRACQRHGGTTIRFVIPLHSS
jgi:signal transduction histidine kinase